MAPVAHAGYEEGYLETVRVTWADTERGHGPVGKAIRTRELTVLRDVTHHPDFAPRGGGSPAWVRLRGRHPPVDRL